MAISPGTRKRRAFIIGLVGWPTLTGVVACLHYLYFEPRIVGKCDAELLYCYDDSAAIRVSIFTAGIMVFSLVSGILGTVCGIQWWRGGRKNGWYLFGACIGVIATLLLAELWWGLARGIPAAAIIPA